MSALLCFGISFLFASCSLLLNDLIRSRQLIRRNRQANLLRRLEIHYWSNFFGCSTGKSAGLAPFNFFHYFFIFIFTFALFI